LSQSTLTRLQELLTPGELVYIFNEPPAQMDGLSVGPPLHTFQMLGPEVGAVVETREGEISPILMTSDDTGEMFELITLAFPGFYQPRTYEMGTYYGIRVDGKLVLWPANGCAWSVTVRSAGFAHIRVMWGTVTRRS